MNEQTIQEKLDRIQQRIQIACQEARRAAGSVQLIIVTKGQSPKKIEEVIDAGAVALGENYPEETERKVTEIPSRSKAVWHMIGHLQSRKIKKLHPHFTWIHSIDSLDLAQKVNRYYASMGQQINVLLEVNLANEATKSGFRTNTNSERNDFEQVLDIFHNLANLNLRGLMTMPPLALSPDQSAENFLKLKNLLESIRNRFDFQHMDQLSMGTSHDFETAIRCGATMVRIGEAIMGNRNYN